MVKKAQDDEFYANNLRTFRFTLTNEDDGGDPLDLTGLELKWAMSRVSEDGVYSTKAVVEKCTEDSTITIIDAPNGIIELSLTPTDTENLSGIFYHQLEVFDGASSAIVVAEGTFTILRNIINEC